MSKVENTRRAGNFGELQCGGHDSANVKGGRQANINRSTHAVQRARYTQAEANRRKDEARHRIERQREQRQAARYFRKLEVVRRV